MLKGGLFIDSRGVNHSVYIMEAGNYKRIDICTPGAQFHVEPDKVEFSLVKSRKTLVYGNGDLNREMEELMNTLKFSKLESFPPETEWVDGKFRQKITRGTSERLFQEMVMVNGRTDSETYVHEDMLLTLSVISYDINMTMQPINRADYTDVELHISDKDSASSPYIPVSVLRTRFNLSWLDDRDYQIVKDVTEAKRLIDSLDDNVSKDVQIGIDTETTGLDFHLYSTEELVGVIISPKRRVSWYFPFKHKKFENLPWDFLEYIAEAMRKTERRKCAHNKKYEKKVFKKVKVDVPIEDDSYQVSVLKNPMQAKGIHSLKYLIGEISGNTFLEFEHIFTDKNNINFADLDEETVRVYACPDADNTPEVFESEWKGLPEYTRELYYIESELAELKADQEYWGFRVDMANFMEGQRTCDYNIAMLEKMIHTLTRTEFNLSSGDKLADLLYNRMKCPIYVRTKTNKASTGAKAIKKLSLQKREEPFDIVKSDIVDDQGRQLISAKALNEAKYPVVVLLEKYREFVKLKTAFYNRIQKGSIGARYFFWINQNGAESGRQSSPMHQLPKTIKKDIIADSSEHVIYDSDYSQIELRLTFSLAGEQILIDLCKDPDNDIHRAVDSGISVIEMWAISADSRQQGKSRNFGVVYLISGNGLAVQRHGASPSKEQVKQADDDLALFFHTYKRVAKFIKENRKEIEKKGKMRTFFGRTRYFDKIFDPDLPREKKNTMIRQGNNHPVQGTAADIMKIAEVNLNNYIKAKGWDKLVKTPEGEFPLVRVMISAHDEALVSGHMSIPAEEILEMKKKCMEIKITNGVNAKGEPIEFAPLFTDTCLVDNWLEGKDDQFSIPYKLRDKLIEDYKRTGKSCLTPKLVKDAKGNTKPDMKEEMLTIINKYRDEELTVYMEEIIAEVGEDADAITDKVRHPSLTHELISRFKQSDDHKAKHGKLEHLPSIKYAVEKYLEFRKDPEFKKPVIEVQEESVQDRSTDEMTKQYFEEVAGLSEELTFVDSEGEVHYIGEEDHDEDMAFMFDDENEFIDATTAGEVVRYWELQDLICIDTTGMFPQDIDELLKLLFTYRDPKGWYELYITHNGKMVNTGIKAEKVDKKEILDFIESKLPQMDLA